MRIFIITIIIICVVTEFSANAQLRLKSTESYNSKTESIAVDNSNGAILKSQLNGGVQNLYRNGVSFGSIPADEKVYYISGDRLYSIKPQSHNSMLMTRYDLKNGQSLKQGTLEYIDSYPVFFTDGSFVTVDQEEGFGEDVKFYTEDLQYVKSYRPFPNGYSAAQCGANKNRMALAFEPLGADELTRLATFNSKGEFFFDKEVETERKASILTYSGNYSAIGYFNSGLNKEEIVVYGADGSFLWRKNIGSSVQQWSFYGSLLIMATNYDILIFNAENGSVIDQKRLVDLYKEAGVTQRRSDNAVTVAGINPIENSSRVCVLLTEQVEYSVFKNTRLYVFDRNLDVVGRIFEGGDSKALPKIKNANGGDVLIITDQQIERYGF